MRTKCPFSTQTGRGSFRPIADITTVDDVPTVQPLTEQPFYFAFTDGWGDEPIVRCEPVARSTANPRLVVCAVEPPIGGKRTVVLYDRFSEGAWLPVNGQAQVGVLLGDVEPDNEPDVTELDLAYWGTVFADNDAAQLARKRLRPSGQT
jgi:hypothetical protein